MICQQLTIVNHYQIVAYNSHPIVPHTQTHPMRGAMWSALQHTSIVYRGSIAWGRGGVGVCRNLL